MNISYDSYTFQSPSTIFGDESIYVAGKLDSIRERIQVVGIITGANLTALSNEKKNMTEALLSSFGDLDIGGSILNGCKPISVSFSESDLTTILPYSVEFERFKDDSFSQYFGVLNPTDSWTYTEQEGRIVSAVHKVSALGIKVDATDPFENAKSFVEGRIADGFTNLSFANPDVDTAILRNKTEEIDRFLNSYSVTEEYSFSTSSAEDPSGFVISAKTQINYSKKSESSITVDGTILGEVNGTPVTESLFSLEDARVLASNALNASKSSGESSLYETLEKDPTSYSYTTNEKDNSIQFSFNFSDVFGDIKDDVSHYYTVSVSANKDSAIISVSIDGELNYHGTGILLSGQAPEDSEGYNKVDARFSQIDPYGLALAEYQNFYSVSDIYDGNSYLNPDMTSESITKSPYVPSISYSYSYNNKPSEGLKNLTVDYTDNKEMIRKDYIETLGGFSTTSTSLLGRNSVRASCQNSGEASLSTLKGLVNSYLKDLCVVSEESQTQGTSSLEYSKGGYYND